MSLVQREAARPGVLDADLRDKRGARNGMRSRIELRVQQSVEVANECMPAPSLYGVLYSGTEIRVHVACRAQVTSRLECARASIRRNLNLHLN